VKKTSETVLRSVSVLCSLRTDFDSKSRISKDQSEQYSKHTIVFSDQAKEYDSKNSNIILTGYQWLNTTKTRKTKHNNQIVL